jgi:hypothetical protein
MGTALRSPLAQGRCAIISLARLAARKEVKERLRAQGLRLSRVKASEVEERAREYLADHPELYWEALDRACKIGLIDPEDRERFLDLLNITLYFVADRETGDGKSGIEKPREIALAPG